MRFMSKAATLVKQWQPWKHSTGARSEEGKANSSQNAFKHGLRSAGWLAESKRVNDVLRRCREALLAVN